MTREDLSKQRTLRSKKENAADLRRKPFSRIGEDPEAGNKCVMFEEQQGQIVRRGKISKGHGYEFVHNLS